MSFADGIRYGVESRSAAGGSCERALCGELEGSDADTKAKIGFGQVGGDRVTQNRSSGRTRG